MDKDLMKWFGGVERKNEGGWEKGYTWRKWVKEEERETTIKIYG